MEYIALWLLVFLWIMYRDYLKARREYEEVCKNDK